MLRHMPTGSIGSSIAEVADSLAHDGIVVSHSTIRRCADLLEVKRVRTGQYRRRTFNDDDVVKLEWLVTLRELGLTTKEIRRWLQSPSKHTIVNRVKQVSLLVDRVRTLVEQLPDDEASASSEDRQIAASPDASVSLDSIGQPAQESDAQREPAQQTDTTTS